MKFLSIKTRVTIYFTLMMVLVVVLVFGVILIAGRGVISDTAEGTLLDVVHDEIDDVEFDGGWTSTATTSTSRPTPPMESFSAARAQTTLTARKNSTTARCAR